nr:type IV pilin-like G/H family protein [Elusimicrobium minutum]
MALPQYTKAVDRARASEAVLILKAMVDAQERYYLANGFYAKSIDDLDIDVPATTKNFTFGIESGTGRYVSATPVKFNGYSFEFHTDHGAPTTPLYHGARWCRATTSNEKAKSMCLSMGGKLSTRISHGTTTYYDLN